jgi:hypothetical protein
MDQADYFNEHLYENEMDLIGNVFLSYYRDDS